MLVQGTGLVWALLGSRQSTVHSRQWKKESAELGRLLAEGSLTFGPGAYLTLFGPVRHWLPSARVNEHTDARSLERRVDMESPEVKHLGCRGVSRRRGALLNENIMPE
jgi:hypothetical protein